jgi:hypothetical protein
MAEARNSRSTVASASATRARAIGDVAANVVPADERVRGIAPEDLAPFFVCAVRYWRIRSILYLKRPQ